MDKRYQIEPIVEKIHKNRYPLLLFSIFLMLALYPYLSKNRKGEFILIILNIMIMSSSLIPFYSQKMRFMLFLYSSLIVITIGVYIFRTFYGSTSGSVHLTGLLGFLLLYSYLVYKISQDIFYRKVITSETISGGICVYVLAGAIWAMLYQTVFILSPDAFTKGTTPFEDMDFMFYSFSTLTTLGEGGILPQSATAKSLSLLELIFGVMYTTIFLAKLVAAYSQERIFGKPQQ